MAPINGRAGKKDRKKKRLLKNLNHNKSYVKEDYKLQPNDYMETTSKEGFIAFTKLSKLLGNKHIHTYELYATDEDNNFSKFETDEEHEEEIMDILDNSGYRMNQGVTLVCVDVEKDGHVYKVSYPYYFINKMIRIGGKNGEHNCDKKKWKYYKNKDKLIKLNRDNKLLALGNFN